MVTGREELCDLLLDLQHDLGKYLRQPLAYLPAAATSAEVQAAARRALFETRRGAQGVRSARQLWSGFVAKTHGALADFAGYAPLAHAVAQALSWEAVVGAEGAALDRAALAADLGAVEPAIRLLIEELHGRA